MIDDEFAGCTLAADVRGSAMSEDVGARIVAALGEPGARELLDVLERSDADRAALIGRLYARDDARWVAELLMDGPRGRGGRDRTAAADRQAPRATRLIPMEA